MQNENERNFHIYYQVQGQGAPPAAQGRQGRVSIWEPSTVSAGAPQGLCQSRVRHMSIAHPPAAGRGLPGAAAEPGTHDPRLLLLPQPIGHLQGGRH